jgi:hypothetical protein
MAHTLFLQGDENPKFKGHIIHCLGKEAPPLAATAVY